VNRQMIQTDTFLRLSLRLLRRVASSSRTQTNITASLLFMTAVFAFAQDSKSGPSAQVSQSEFQRMIEGLKRARPTPDPPHGITPLVVTAPGGLVRFDPKTGKSAVIDSARISADALQNGSGRDAGQSGIQLKSTNGSLSSQARAVGQVQNELTPDFNTHPNPPHIDAGPYSLPFNAEYQLLARFVVPNATDQFFACSATTASSFHLISAGHCVYNHDPLGDGSGRGAGFAAEVWAWPAQTDVVDPPYDNGWTDFPYGVSKMTFMTTYNGWINNSDFNWDMSFITLDRRIGDLTGWSPREFGVQGTTLAFAGYPLEAPFVPQDNPFLYIGLDNNNVISYTTNRINLSAFSYGGMSGGGVFRFDGSQYVLEGVNSTSDRNGNAQATRFTQQESTDLANLIATDRTTLPPVDKAAIIEYQFDDNSKDLPVTSFQPGDFFDFTFNALNAGFVLDTEVEGSVYLVQSPSAFFDPTAGIFCGTASFGSLASFEHVVQTHQFRVPSNTPPGEYYVTWLMAGTAQDYGDNRQQAILTKKKLAVVGLSPSARIQITPDTVAAGTPSTGLVILNDPAPADGISITLASNNGAVQVPFLLQLPAGATSGTFPITTTAVTTPIVATITAAALNSTQTGNIAVSPALENTTGVLQSTLNPSTLGQNVTITGTVHGTKTTTTGTVQLMLGSTQLGSAALTGGVARFTLSTLPVGIDPLVLVYSGDKTHQASTSAAFNQTVLDPTTVTLASTPNPSNLGQAVTFTATVQGQTLTATGQVQLKRGSTVLATTMLSGGNASFTITTVPLGTSGMEVFYSGDANHAAKSSASLNQVVVKAP
jgi:Bacterial Ig-like domain (group 3)